MKIAQKIIVITGAESTGKSVLTEWLSNYFHTPFLPEFAREYIEKLYKKYSYDDVELIAREQVIRLETIKTKNSAAPYIFIDTWLIITKIWFEVVFNRLPSWLDDQIKNTPIDLFLVCDTDLPWIPDPVRENGGKQREILQKKYIETIKNYNFNYKIVSGKNQERNNNALQYLRQMNSQV
jgi:NadR type nicotinamide-nucleotide adenylyltransferase